MSSEQPFKQAVRKALFEEYGVVTWPQPAGRLPVRNGGMVECAPVGAADLTGILEPHGTRIEIEIKGIGTPETKGQPEWRDWIKKHGGIAVLVRWEKGDAFDKAIEKAMATIGRAIWERRGR